MASNLPQPLNLPDILGITFSFLDQKSLSACAQVNSLWADSATNILWQKPPISALASLISSGRAQAYANKITNLRIFDDKPESVEIRLAHRHLHFARLRQISWVIHRPVCTQPLLLYFQPSLRSFWMMLPERKAETNSPEHNAALDALFLQLSTRCPHLEKVTLDFTSLSWNRLLQYLEATRSLRSIALSGDGVFANEVMQHLAARPNLTTLHIVRPILGDVAAQTEANTACLFPDLEYFECQLKDDTISSLVRHMQKLEVLRIGLYHPSTTLFAAISRIPALRILTIRFKEPDLAMKALDLISLAEGCQRLTQITIMGSSYRRAIGPNQWKSGMNVDDSNIKDVDICRFSSFLPELEKLYLDCGDELSVRSLHHLGRNCPRLRDCALRGCIFDFSRFLEYSHSDMMVTQDGHLGGLDKSCEMIQRPDLAIMRPVVDSSSIKNEKTGGSRPLFPKLERLELKKFINSLDITISMVLWSLRLEAPQLGFFCARTVSQFDEEVAKVFVDRLRRSVAASQTPTDT